MAQVKRVTWTNASSAVARNQSVGFTVTRATVTDITNGGQWTWTKGMADASYLTVSSGTITTSNGFTPLSQGALYGAPISAITAANPAVITATDIAASGIVAGDTIKVTGIADDGTGTTLNGDYTVASVSATEITTATDTSSGYSVYVSGGHASRVSDTNGDPVSTVNFGIDGMTIGTGAVGGGSASMVAVFEGDMNVT